MEVQRKIEALELVEELGNISKAARILDCSRQTLYTYQKIMAEQGAIGLKRINKPLKRSKNRIPESAEDKIIELTLQMRIPVIPDTRSGLTYFWCVSGYSMTFVKIKNSTYV
jgi:hypothetical protein